MSQSQKILVSNKMKNDAHLRNFVKEKSGNKENFKDQKYRALAFMNKDGFAYPIQDNNIVPLCRKLKRNRNKDIDNSLVNKSECSANDHIKRIAHITDQHTMENDLVSLEPLKVYK